MIEELKEIFSKFADENDLRCELTKGNLVWIFTLQNRQQSWGYRRVITLAEIQEYQKRDSGANELATCVLEKALDKMRFYKLI